MCSDDRESVSILRDLFGPHLLLGFSSSTGSTILDVMFGGMDEHGFTISPHFFERVADDPYDLEKVRDAWILTAIEGHAGNAEMEPIFRAIDPDGTEWKIENGEKVRGNTPGRRPGEW